MNRVVLDAGAFDTLHTAAGAKMRDLLARTLTRGGEVCCAAVTLAEVARGTARTRQLESALSRKYGGDQIRVLVTDKEMAKLVGRILHAAKKGSAWIADAHVIAACFPADVAVVMTTDPSDINELAAVVPGVKIMIRTP
ncbi:MAG TPA: type II toxin-antitoxin system VapC family toxin [Propionibacteriaceae bacterium]|nr:type II toxin-antitoxin system VapC family toxin [Propionibacteriaceae bacterium]